MNLSSLNQGLALLCVSWCTIIFYYFFLVYLLFVFQLLAQILFQFVVFYILQCFFFVLFLIYMCENSRTVVRCDVDRSCAVLTPSRIGSEPLPVCSGESQTSQAAIPVDRDACRGQ